MSMTSERPPISMPTTKRPQGFWKKFYPVCHTYEYFAHEQRSARDGLQKHPGQHPPLLKCLFMAANPWNTDCRKRAFLSRKQ